MRGADMKQEQQTGKRIVSKREYAALVGKREVRRWGSVGLAVAVALCLLPAVFCLIYMVSVSGLGWKGLCLLLALVCFAAAWEMKKVAEKAMQEALSKLSVVPLTRGNSADLPAPDSLVRASSEPMQAQEAVLLRAALEVQETPPEELVRAVNGQE